MTSQPAQSEHSRAVFKNNLRGEDAYSRHQRYIRDYEQVYGSGRASGSVQKRTDFDVLKAAHRFIRDEDEDPSKLSWDDKLASKYSNSLYKEYAICDLKHYKSGDVALRWRTEEEVLSGTGQDTCANTRCAYHERPRDRKIPPLRVLEVPFAYVEDDERKSALVKVVLCDRCSRKLIWKRDKDREHAVKKDIKGNVLTGDVEETAELGELDHPGDRHYGSSRYTVDPSSRRRSASPPRRRGSS